jgi:hypothetical protein
VPTFPPLRRPSPARRIENAHTRNEAACVELAAETPLDRRGWAGTQLQPPAHECALCSLHYAETRAHGTHLALASCRTHTRQRRDRKPDASRASIYSSTRGAERPSCSPGTTDGIRGIYRRHPRYLWHLWHVVHLGNL